MIDQLLHLDMIEDIPPRLGNAVNTRTGCWK
jgi:hypothetical protein